MQSCFVVSVPAVACVDADLDLTDQHWRHSEQVTQQLHSFCMVTILLFWLQQTQSADGVVTVGVGCINNTFGIKGVQEHTFFFKSITDANKLRRQVSECFERAALPNTSQEVRHPTVKGRNGWKRQKVKGRNDWQRAIRALFLCIAPVLLIDPVLLAVSALMKCFYKTLQKRIYMILTLTLTLTLALPYLS